MRALLLCLSLLAFAAQAQTAIPVVAKVTVTPPTTSSDGSALTGALAITRYEYLFSTSPIPATSTGVEATSTVPTYTWVGSGTPGSPIYVGVRVCNAFGCGPLLTKSGTVVAPVPGIPGAIVIVITVTP